MPADSSNEAEMMVSGEPLKQCQQYPCSPMDARDAFKRLDEGDDGEYYAQDRMVSHLDSLALRTVTSVIGQLVVEELPVILDLMASWDSHIPADIRPSRVVGLGLNTVSVDYLTRPVDVFKDVARVLRPGGLFLVVFSNRMFPDKAVRVWCDSSEEERVILVEEFFSRAGGFEKPQTFVSRGRPRPRDDKYADHLSTSDRIYAVYAE